MKPHAKAEPDRMEPDSGRIGLQRVSLYLSLAALMISVPMGILSAISEIKKSEIDIVGPRSLLIYKNKPLAREMLSIAVPLTFLNHSPAYTDLLVDASIRPATGEPFFPMSRLLSSAQNVSIPADEQCKTDQCFELYNLKIVEDPNPTLEIPARSSRTKLLSFDLVTSRSCRKSAAKCDLYQDTASAFRQIGNKPLDVEIRLKFHLDGEKIIRCGGMRTVSPALLDRTVPAGPEAGDGKPERKWGWASTSCVERTLADDSFF